MTMTDAVFQRCVRAYYRYCNQHGYIFQQSSSSSDWEDEDAGIFKLNNVNGVLGRYKVTGDEVDGFTIRRLENQS
jgi:hypothetical protein